MARQLFRRVVACVIGVEHERYVPALVLAVEFGAAVVVADQGTVRLSALPMAIPLSSEVAAWSRHCSESSGCNPRARWLRRSSGASTLLCGFPLTIVSTFLHAARISSATRSASSATGDQEAPQQRIRTP
jgi:hypothetical protein